MRNENVVVIMRSENNVLEPCPFCGTIPELVIESLEQTGGRGYPGKYIFSIKCLNDNCLVNPSTNGHCTLHTKSQSDCILFAYNDWNNSLRDNKIKKK